MPVSITDGIHHVELVCRDPVAALSFYRDLLGLRLLARSVDPDDPYAWRLYLGDACGRPGSLVVLSEWKGAERGHPGIGGVHHVAFGTRDEESLLRWKRRLSDAGYQVSGPYDRRYFTSVYLSDPDGQIVEIATDGPGYTVDEPADALGRSLKLPDDHELRGRRDEHAIAARTHPDPVPAVIEPMRLTGIHHVSALTQDVEEANDFYGAALGLRRVKRTVNRDAQDMAHHFWARYEGGLVGPNSSWTLFGMPGSGRRARAGTGQTRLVAFRARDEAQLEGWRAQLSEAGAEPSPVLDRILHRSVLFDAPDGQQLEIATDLQVAQEEDPGDRLLLPHHLEAQRTRIEAALTPL